MSRPPRTTAGGSSCGWSPIGRATAEPRLEWLVAAAETLLGFPNGIRRLVDVDVRLRRELARFVSGAFGRAQPPPRVCQLGARLLQLLGAARGLGLRRSLRGRRGEAGDRVEAFECEGLRELSRCEELSSLHRDRGSVKRGGDLLENG